MNVIIDGLSHGHTKLSQWENCSQPCCVLCLSYLKHVTGKTARNHDNQQCKLCAEVGKAVTNHCKQCSTEACCVTICSNAKTLLNNTESDFNRNDSTLITIRDIHPFIVELLTEPTQEYRKSIVLPEIYEDRSCINEVTQLDDLDTGSSLRPRGSKRPLFETSDESLSGKDLDVVNERFTDMSLHNASFTSDIRNSREENMLKSTNRAALFAYVGDMYCNVTMEENDSYVKQGQFNLPPGVMGPPTVPPPQPFPELSDLFTPGLGHVAKGTPADIKIFSQHWANWTEVGRSGQEEGVLFHEKLIPINGRYAKDEHWQLTSKIGGGAQGSCYLTVDLSSEYISAVKEVCPPHYRAEEIEIWGDLIHPNISRMYMYGILRDENFYYFMEYIYGCNLAEFVSANKKLREEIALECLQQILDGLIYLHEMRIIHGDIKVDNIVITEDRQAIVLIDFGLARQLPHNVSAIPRGEPATGTYAYQSPEVRFKLGHDCKADVWSAVCVLYFMLEGATPSFDFKQCKYYCDRFPCQHTGYRPFSEASPPDCYSDKVKEVFMQGWHYDPGLRASVQKLKDIVRQ